MSETEGVHKFETGAQGSKDAMAVRYDLVSPIAMRRMAETYAHGCHYGEMNWELGLSITENVNRVIRHCYEYLAGDRSEDHLAHAMTRCGFAIHSEELWPDLNTNLRSPGCTPPSKRAEPHAEPAPEVAKQETFCSNCTSKATCDELGCFNEWVETITEPAPQTKAVRLHRPHRIPRLNDPRDGSVPPPVLYVSGPMSGLEAFNFPAFNAAADALRAKGFPVLNPADFGWAEEDWAKNLHRDLVVLGYADILVQLPGWENSRGASLEFNCAVSLGKGVVSLSEILCLS